MNTRTIAARETARIITDAPPGTPITGLRKRLRDAGPRNPLNPAFRIWHQEAKKAIAAELDRRKQVRRQGNLFQ